MAGPSATAPHHSHHSPTHQAEFAGGCLALVANAECKLNADHLRGADPRQVRCLVQSDVEAIQTGTQGVDRVLARPVCQL